MSKKLPKDLNALGESLELVFNFRWIELHCHSEAYTLRLGIRQSTKAYTEILERIYRSRRLIRWASAAGTFSWSYPHRCKTP